jgi:hypothetical protein
MVNQIIFLEDPFLRGILFAIPTGIIISIILIIALKRKMNRRNKNEKFKNRSNLKR